MNKQLLVPAVVVSILSGCASVPMESEKASATAKEFEAPAQGTAGLYIYRYGSFAYRLKKGVWVDGKCIGETAANVFFYHEVPANKEYKISTESEFSPNDLLITVKPGINYFISQYFPPGLYLAGAGVELVDEKQGMAAVKELSLAKKGTCS